MSIIRYQTLAPRFAALHPLSRLSAFQQEVDQLFGFVPSLVSNGQAGGSPTLDLYQSADNFVVQAELPGLRREAITLSLHDDRLTVSGERPSGKAPDGTSAVRRERSSGRFERTLTLPAPVDGTRVHAAYQDGVLTVTLPKAEAAKPRQIEIAS